MTFFVMTTSLLRHKGFWEPIFPSQLPLLSGQSCCNFSVQMKSIESHRKRRGPQCLTAPGRQLACNMISSPVFFFVCCARALSMGYWMSPGRCCGIKEANFELGYFSQRVGA